jgi:hypothetical protein
MILGIGGLTAFGIAAFGTSEPANTQPADPAAVAHYIDRLAETVPPSPAAALAKDPPPDGKLAKTAQRLDRAEPILGAVLDRGR